MTDKEKLAKLMRAIEYAVTRTGGPFSMFLKAALEDEGLYRFEENAGMVTRIVRLWDGGSGIKRSLGKDQGNGLMPIVEESVEAGE